MIAKSSTGRDNIGAFLCLSKELADNAVGLAKFDEVSDVFDKADSITDWCVKRIYLGLNDRQ
jgi:hypothetical protein